MRKFLLSMAAVLMSLAVSAQDGITAVGANIAILPSARWSKAPYKAKVLVVNPDYDYGSDWSDKNGNYNLILLEDGPAKDANGKAWYEIGYDETTLTEDEFDCTEDGFFRWTEQTAPFSSDETWNGMKSFQWTGNSKIADIYIRRTFSTNRLLSGDVYLACGHDDAPCEYYLNGQLIFSKTGYEIDHYEYIYATDDEGKETDEILDSIPRYKQGWNNDEVYKLTDEQKKLILLDGQENLLAVRVHQNWGGAFADCGLYTLVEGGLAMGYVEPWEGKVLFNNVGGYNFDGKSPSNNPKHPWSALYEAQEGDEYTFTMPGASNVEDNDCEWKEQLHFKTPIPLEESVFYTVKFTLTASCPYSSVRIKICDNDNDEEDATAYDDVEEILEGTPLEFETEIAGKDAIHNLKLVFDFGGGEENSTIKISNLSIKDDDGNELWVGTHYFNYFHMCKRVTKYYVWDQSLKNGEGDYREAKTDEEKENPDDIKIVYEEADAPEVTGRVETLAWTLPDFDDSMWDSQMMPVGNKDYMAEVQTVWPGGDNTNYWIRRNFELDRINDRLSYALNVCHDDVYETYVNGHLLQKNVGWTNGKNPVQVHIPARYLNVGKNVIATYIQQNWGGKFYDCGINVEEVNYDESVKQFNEAIAYAQTDTLLTNKMHSNVQALIDQAYKDFDENKNDPAEIKNFARELVSNANAIFAYSSSVKLFKDTWDICRKMKDTGYWGTALTDATAALDTCATSGDLNKYLEPLRNARKATAMERRTEKFVGCTPQVLSQEWIGIEEDEDFKPTPRYYIYNVGAKQFLCGGEDWGTHLALAYASNPMMLVQAMKDVVDEDGLPTGDEEAVEGAFLLETFRPNGEIGSMDFMGWNGYVDCAPNNSWELIPVEGKPNVYNIAQYGQTFSDADTTCYNGTIFNPGGKKLLGLRSGDNKYAPSYYVVDTDLHSPELETNQWMFISREEMLGFISSATEDNPADLTFLIKNPGYDQRLTDSEWNFTGGSILGRGSNLPNFVLESYDQVFFQNYTDLWPYEEDRALPAGTYKLMVQGYYRDGIEQAHVEKVLKHEAAAQRAFIFAGAQFYGEEDLSSTDTIPLMSIHMEANKVPGIGYTYGGMTMPGTYSGQPMNATQQAATEYFPCGLYWNELTFIIPEEEAGHLCIGICKPTDAELAGKGDWIVMDNWRLKYCGSNADPDGINDVIKTPSQASKEIFNLSGQKLKKAQKGINIVNGKKYVVK
ncbi:MAG: hypothetical protein J5524_10500 [Bacteroidaceae bacterium]|nr:hypothetical protein [Bacteroidaceae bacterium]